MYPPLGINGLKTKPGLPGTGLASGNCAAAVFCADGDDLAVLDVVDPDFRDAARDFGVGEGTATGCPGLVTSDVFCAGVGSGSPKT